MSKISEVAHALSNLRDEVNAAGSVTQNMTISVAAGSVVIEANRSGLIELARQILLVATKEANGSHQDFDGSGFASRWDATLTVSLNNTLR